MPAAWRRVVSNCIISFGGILSDTLLFLLMWVFHLYPSHFFPIDFGAMSIPVFIIPCSTFLITCLRTFPNLRVGIESLELSALFLDLLTRYNMSLPLTLRFVLNCSMSMPLSFTNYTSTFPPFPGAVLDFNHILMVFFITAFIGLFFISSKNVPANSCSFLF